MKTFNIIIFQKPLGISVSHEDMKDMKAFHPHFVCFPEYFFVNRVLDTFAQTEENQNAEQGRIRDISEDLDCVVIGGTMPEIDGDKMYNTCFIYEKGRLLGSYRKINLFEPEKGKITPGAEYKIFQANGIKFGVMICLDVLSDEGFIFMRNHGTRIIFAPTFSPKKIETADVKFKRDNDIYVRGANLSGSVIVKACGAPDDFKSYIQARSLIADKTGIIYRTMPEDEGSSMIIKRTVTIAD